MSAEEVSVVSVAIQLALEWATEMMVKEPENTGCKALISAAPAQG
jgi:hypothetical protein